MSRNKHTDASKRYGLPEVPDPDINLTGSRKGKYDNLKKLGTKPHAIREIIYYREKLTQGELGNELRKYGYDPSNNGVLSILDEVTHEIKREGSKNDTEITWVGEIGRNMNLANRQPLTSLEDSEIEIGNLEWKTGVGGQVSNIPTHETIDVVSYATIDKNDGWWKAIVIHNQYEEDRIAVYLWRKTGNGGWTRKQKYGIRSPEDWKQDQQAIQEAVGKIGE